MLGVSKNILDPAASLLHSFYEFVYPPVCLACETSLDDSARRICAECMSSIRRLSSDDALYREKLAEVTVHGSISGIASAFHFEKDGTLQKLIHHLKYDGMTRIGTELGNIVGELIPQMLGDIQLSALVPVPLHPLKKRERRYNQSEFVCRGISAATGIALYSDLLQCTRYTKTQTQLDVHERRENVAQAFAINAKYESFVRGSSLLIADDIITTGATVEECAKILKAAGASKVYAASIAIPDHSHLP